MEEQLQAPKRLQLHVAPAAPASTHLTRCIQQAALDALQLQPMTSACHAGLKVEIEGLTESKVDSTAMDGYAKQISQVSACADLDHAWPRSALDRCSQATRHSWVTALRVLLTGPRLIL